MPSFLWSFSCSLLVYNHKPATFWLANRRTNNQLPLPSCERGKVCRLCSSYFSYFSPPIGLSILRFRLYIFQCWILHSSISSISVVPRYDHIIDNSGIYVRCRKGRQQEAASGSANGVSTSFSSLLCYRPLASHFLHSLLSNLAVLCLTQRRIYCS